MSNFESNDAASQAKATEQPLAILSHLPQAIVTMHHVDELFRWLAAQCIQRFSVQVAEIWSLQSDQVGQYPLQLRALVTGDNSLPQHVVANNHVAEFAMRLFSEQRSYPPQAINLQFSQYPASTLARFGLSYVTGYYFHNPMTPLPMARHLSSGGSGFVPFTLAIVLFQREQPYLDLHAALQAILPQIVLAAKNQGLLSVERVTPFPPVTSSAPYTPIPQQNSGLSLWQLIPHRHREDTLLTSSNPLSRSVDIPDKQARRLYSAINGRKSLAELSRDTRMEPPELLRALQYLIAHNRIELYEPGGKRINPAHFLP